MGNTCIRNKIHLAVLNPLHEQDIIIGKNLLLIKNTIFGN